MSGLFVNMLKEEWRVHSTIFGSINFVLFPVMIFAMGFMGTFLIPLIQTSVSMTDLIILIHANYLMLGFMVGAFGLLGNEAMNRRFGQASLLAFSARTLPFSPRYIFTIFVLKDTLYYFFLWIFPLGAGFLIGSLFTGIPVHLPMRLLLTLTLAFLSGMSMVFFLSVIYARSARLLMVILGLGAVILLLMVQVTDSSPTVFFPAYLLFFHFTVEILLVTTIGILLPFIIAILFFSPDTGFAKKIYKNRMKPLIETLSFFPNPPLAAKDIIDLWRSGSIVGQTLFSFLIPLVVIWFFLSLLGDFVSVPYLLCNFAMVTGIIASTMYTWLTMFDSFQVYSVLPVDVRDVIISKIVSFGVLQVIPAVFIISVTILSGQMAYLLPVLILTLSVSLYALGITIWLTGLNPSVLVYSAKVMIRYFGFIGAGIILFSSLVAIDPGYAILSVLLLIPAYGFIWLGLKKWEREESSYF